MLLDRSMIPSGSLAFEDHPFALAVHRGHMSVIQIPVVPSRARVGTRWPLTCKNVHSLE